MAFGTYDPLGANSGTGSDLDQTGSVGVTCTRGSTGITIELSDGGNHSGATRRMANGGLATLHQSKELLLAVGRQAGVHPGRPLRQPP